jgi:two-component system, LytTR family, response regulator LytT
MIKVVIIEDEMLAAKRVKKLLSQLDHDIEIIAHCDSIEASVNFLQNNQDVDLLLMDIHLGDGLSLEILKQVEIKVPIIFTTAYDEYTLKAFKLNSVDYLLKPIELEDLAFAFQKFQNLYQKEQPTLDIQSLLSKLNSPTYKERFLIKHGTQLVIVSITDVAYFYTEEGYTHLVTHDHKTYLLDDTLDTLQKDLNPQHFFRINRAMIVKVESIGKIEQYFNSRYSLHLAPNFKGEVIVSRERVKEFKDWISG